MVAIVMESPQKCPNNSDLGFVVLYSDKSIDVWRSGVLFLPTILCKTKLIQVIVTSTFVGIVFSCLFSTHPKQQYHGDVKCHDNREYCRSTFQATEHIFVRHYVAKTPPLSTANKQMFQPYVTHLG